MRLKSSENVLSTSRYLPRRSPRFNPLVRHPGLPQKACFGSASSNVPRRSPRLNPLAYLCHPPHGFEKSTDTEMNFNSMPNEIIINIFQYLEQNELGRIARVCKRWRELTRCPLLWKKVVVKFHTSHKSQNKVVRLLCVTLPPSATHIELCFWDYWLWKDSLNFYKFCLRLRAHCPSLKTLMLKRARFYISLQSVLDLCCHFLPDLEKVSFYYCRFMPCSVKVEPSNHSKIKVLNIDTCDGTPNSRNLNFSKMTSLRTLRLTLTDLYDNCFQGDISFLQNLEVLDLNTAIIGPSTIRTLQMHALNLTELYLCHTFTKDSDFNFCNSMFPLLKTLCLVGCSVTCEGVVSLAQACQSLQDIFVWDELAENYSVHPFRVADPCKLGIVKAVQICKHWFYDLPEE